MKEKKLVGKIVTTIFTALLVLFFFTPLLSFSAYISVGSISNEGPLAKYVTPAQVIAAQFASEEDLEKAESKLEALQVKVEAMSGLTSEQQTDRIASSEEAATYYTILFSQEKDLMGVFVPSTESGENMVGAMKLYTCFSLGLLLLIISLITILILRCIHPEKKGFILSGNILSISVFVLSVSMLFITLPMVLEARLTLGSELLEGLNLTITPNPNLLFNGILIASSLLVMILTLITKGLRKDKKDTISAL